MPRCSVLSVGRSARVGGGHARGRPPAPSGATSTPRCWRPSRALARQIAVPARSAESRALANALAERDPDQAALLRDHRAPCQPRRRSANEVTQNVLVAARLQDWPLALDLAARAIPLLHWASDRPQISGALNVVARAVVDRDPESAAVIQGAARRLAVPLTPEHRTSEGSTATQRPPSPPATTPGSTGG